LQDQLKKNLARRGTNTICSHSRNGETGGRGLLENLRSLVAGRRPGIEGALAFIA